MYVFMYVRTYVCIRKGWFTNTSFTTGLKTLPMSASVGKVFNPVGRMFRPDALVFFRAKKPLRPEEDQSIWLKRQQGFQPCCEAGIGEPTLSDA